VIRKRDELGEKLGEILSVPANANREQFHKGSFVCPLERKLITETQSRTS